MAQQRSVLIVDHSDETREVLSTALARRGLRAYGAPAVAQAEQLAREHPPDLVVLDLEMTELADMGAEDPFIRSGGRPMMVLLGGVRRDRNRFPDGQFVSKPYHYAPLIRRIEELLAGESRPTERVS